MKRYYCTTCGRKRNEKYLTKFKIGNSQKSKWICKSHTSNFSDIIEIGKDEKKNFVELFSGSGHVSKVAALWGYNTITVDIEKKFNPDICIDINNLRRSNFPSSVHVVWASIPCTTYSILSCGTHWNKIKIGYRKYHYAPKTKDAIAALRILSSTIDLIKKLNPVYFFIENPRGALRHFPHLSFVPVQKTVSYADYGFDIYKPTDIWTNCKTFHPKEIKGAVGRKFLSGVMELNTAYERSLIPPMLIEEVLNAVGPVGVVPGQAV